MAGITHTTPITGDDHESKDVSANAWNEEHTIDDAGIPIQKVSIPVQTIAGPDWTEPTGTGPLVIQINTFLGVTSLWVYNGSGWTRLAPTEFGGVF